MSWIPCGNPLCIMCAGHPGLCYTQTATSPFTILTDGWPTTPTPPKMSAAETESAGGLISRYEKAVARGFLIFLFPLFFPIVLTGDLVVAPLAALGWLQDRFFHKGTP